MSSPSSKFRRSWRIRTVSGSGWVIRSKDLGDDETPANPSLVRSVVASWRSNTIDLQVGTQMYEAAFGVRPPNTKFKDSNWLASRIHEAFRLGHLVLLIDPRVDYKSPTEKPKEVEEPEEAPAKPVPAQKKGLEWFRTRLLDEEGKPMAGEEYVVVGSDGAKREGRLDANGEMSIPEILPHGDCSVTFPKIHLNPRKKK